MYGIIMKAREAVKMRHISTIHDQSKASTLRRSRLRNRIHILAEQARCPCCVATQEDNISRQLKHLQDGQIKIVVTRNPTFRIFRLQKFVPSFHDIATPPLQFHCLYRFGIILLQLSAIKAKSPMKKEGFASARGSAIRATLCQET